MVDAARHPKIKLFSYAELKRLDGYVGNFRATVLQKPRYVDVDKCNGCGLCAPPCPIEVPNGFDHNIAPRRAIYIPFQQASPLVYTIDLDNCIKCYKCVEACDDRGAIDFSQEPRELTLDVGTVVVATGFDTYDPAAIGEYGYGRYANVITGPELERLADPSGPTKGRLLRPSDGRRPRRITFIQCVGSRDEATHLHCSGFCCMYTIKNAIWLKEADHEAEITVLYMDIRAPGKGYEEFYRRARGLGIRFVQGRPAEIGEDPDSGDLIVYTEDVRAGRPIGLVADLVVLSTGAVPRADAASAGEVIGVHADPSGFYHEYHPKLQPIDAPTDGVFFAGAAVGPKDIPYSVAQGSAAAARAARILSAGTRRMEPLIAMVDQLRCRNTRLKCGICATKCAYGAVEVAPGHPAHVVAAKCHGCGTCVADCPEDCIVQFHYTDAQILAQIHAALKDEPESKVLAFMCHWCSYGAADTAGTSHLSYPAVSRGIRVMCSGRIDRDFVLEAFRRGAGMVLVSGCHRQDCHYISGQQHADDRMRRLKSYLKRQGISPERLRVEWISAAEGEKYAQVITEMDAALRAFGVERIREENEQARPNLDRVLKDLPDVTIRERELVPVGAI